MLNGANNLISSNLINTKNYIVPEALFLGVLHFQQT